ncbi:flagellar basal body-associated FliL family protein [Salipiger sp. P9]|uniref:flagellar basal body-associated FliL family protein n=1 Tax=Salipiger pentaromativorans TaxID=2943193 RepID=UPI0021577225|nr:flagellar basal body-associated FliL family protein [Salipiger pentaromativorans]MCR8548814.1 flagellar basal body-associated FliL family protein [Salipiger pentaromativorans]
MSDATADTPAEDDAPAKKPSRLPLIIGLVLALAGGGGGFYATWSGLIPLGGGAPAAEGHAAPDTHGAPDAHGDAGAMADVAFVELPQLIISMGSTADLHHLRFRASLEVAPQHAAEVSALQPRVMDVLNTYLRALAPADIEAPGALIKLRSQMLRRVQLVAGDGRVRDLLVLEFVLT